jgi:hypothetical protein
MSLLYQATTKTSIEITEGAYNKVKLLFTSDCGKFGCDEILDEHELTILELLEALQKYEDSQEPTHD